MPQISPSLPRARHESARQCLQPAHGCLSRERDCFSHRCSRPEYVCGWGKSKWQLLEFTRQHVVHPIPPPTCSRHCTVVLAAWQCMLAASRAHKKCANGPEWVAVHQPGYSLFTRNIAIWSRGVVTINMVYFHLHDKKRPNRGTDLRQCKVELRVRQGMRHIPRFLTYPLARQILTP